MTTTTTKPKPKPPPAVSDHRPPPPPPPSSSSSSSVTLLPLAKVRTDGDTQSRAAQALDQAVVEDYAEDLARGCVFPPVVVFFDRATGSYWLACGFHRLAAYRLAGRAAIEAEVLPGTREQARLFAAGSNADHGLRRTRQDKRRSVQMCLEDAAAREWPAKKIAEHCGVSESFARAMKQAGPFVPPAGLFGPDDLAPIPSPRRQQQQRRQREEEEEEEEGEEADERLEREKTLERARRSYRKLVRFAARLGLSLQDLLSRLSASDEQPPDEEEEEEQQQ